MMKNERIHVTSEMSKRFKQEMRDHGQKGYDIAKHLCVEPGTYSRYLTGKIDLYPETLQKLSDLWGVRKNYLLCKDDIRTNGSFYSQKIADKAARDIAIMNLLKASGYNIELVELLAISPRDISEFYDMTVETEFIEPYIIGNNDLWEFVKRTARDLKADKLAPFSDSKFCFELSKGFIKNQIEDIKEDPETGAYPFYDIFDYVDDYARITENSALIGYVRDYRKIFNLMSKTAVSLFTAWLESYRMDIAKPQDIDLDKIQSSDYDLPFA